MWARRLAASRPLHAFRHHHHHHPWPPPSSNCTHTRRALSSSSRPRFATGGFDLTFLGTSSQGGARRYPSCLAVRLRGAATSQVWLFDAGEGATAQLQRSNMRMGLVRNIFISHLHGDHLYGLPGLVMSILSRHDDYSPPPHPKGSATAPGSGGGGGGGGVLRAPQYMDTLNVYGPPGIRAFLRVALGVAAFRTPTGAVLHIHELVWPTGGGSSTQRSRLRSTRPYWRCAVRALPFEGVGRDIEPVEKDGRYTYDVIADNMPSRLSVDNEALRARGEVGLDDGYDAAISPAAVTAAPVLHSVPTYAFRVTESVPPRRFDKEKLRALHIPSDGRTEVRELFAGLLDAGRGTWRGREIGVDDVVQPGRHARSLCVIGDTYDAEPAAHIAADVDVLVHEATNMAAQTQLARARGHSSTLGATAFARRVGARRLILNHTSVAYSERKIRSMEAEARGMFGPDRVFVARDLSVFNVPTREEDSVDYAFRQFAGFADSLEYRNDRLHGFDVDLNMGVEDELDEEVEVEGGVAAHGASGNNWADRIQGIEVEDVEIESASDEIDFGCLADDAADEGTDDGADEVVDEVAEEVAVTVSNEEGEGSRQRQPAGVAETRSKARGAWVG